MAYRSESLSLLLLLLSSKIKLDMMKEMMIYQVYLIDNEILQTLRTAMIEMDKTDIDSITLERPTSFELENILDMFDVGIVTDHLGCKLSDKMDRYQTNQIDRNYRQNNHAQRYLVIVELFERVD